MGRNVLVMGVSGAGKSAVGLALAERLGCGFLDADDLHSPEALAKMAQGEPLTDADRTPWLDSLAGRLRAWRQERVWGVLACSALKRDYRARLREGDPELVLIFLNPAGKVLTERLHRRTSHFMPVSLLDSQLSTLEPPQFDEGPLILDEPSVALAAAKAAAWLASLEPPPDGASDSVALH
jgi:carbohydrate kinase (thermoresistant glucokinase family)